MSIWYLPFVPRRRHTVSRGRKLWNTGAGTYWQQALQMQGPPWQGLEIEADPSRNAMIRHTAAAAVMAFVITGLLSISAPTAIREVEGQRRLQ